MLQTKGRQKTCGRFVLGRARRVLLSYIIPGGVNLDSLTKVMFTRFRTVKLLFSPLLYSLFFRSKSLRSEYVRAQLLSHVRLFVTLYTVACQAPLSMGLSQSAILKEVGKRWWALLPGIYIYIYIYINYFELFCKEDFLLLHFNLPIYLSIYSLIYISMNSCVFIVYFVL